MAEKKQVYSCHKTSYPDSSFFLPAMSPLSTLILMEYSLRHENIDAYVFTLISLNPYSNGI